MRPSQFFLLLVVFVVASSAIPLTPKTRLNIQVHNLGSAHSVDVLVYKTMQSVAKNRRKAGDDSNSATCK